MSSTVSTRFAFFVVTSVLLDLLQFPPFSWSPSSPSQTPHIFPSSLPLPHHPSLVKIPARDFLIFLELLIRAPFPLFYVTLLCCHCFCKNLPSPPSPFGPPSPSPSGLLSPFRLALSPPLLLALPPPLPLAFSHLFVWLSVPLSF